MSIPLQGLPLLCTNVPNSMSASKTTKKKKNEEKIISRIVLFVGLESASVYAIA
jgi:hypothetical protein